MIEVSRLEAEYLHFTLDTVTMEQLRQDPRRQCTEGQEGDTTPAHCTLGNAADIRGLWSGHSCLMLSTAQLNITEQSDPNTVEKFKKLLSIMNLILYIIYELVTTKDHQSWQFKSMVLVGSMIIFYTASARRVHDNIANDKMKT